MTQRYARTYGSAQAVRAHARLSPVGQLDAGVEQHGFEAATQPQRPLGLSRFAPEGALSFGSPSREPIPHDRPEFRAGQTLVATHKGERFTCKVVNEQGRLSFVRPSGQRLASPSATGRSVTSNQVNGYRFWSIL